MVRLTDEGTFDAPLEKIWRFLQDNTSHDHKFIKSRKVLEQTDKYMIVEMETSMDGKTTATHKAKFTFNPPKGFNIEFLAGPQIGSKHTHTYTPMGNKTKVVIEGEFKIQGLDDQATRKAALAFLEQIYNEDNEALRNFK